MERASEAAQTADATNTYYHELYSMGSTSLQMPARPASPVSRAHFRPILDEDTNGIGAEDFEMAEHMPHIVIEEETRVRNIEILRREVELLMLEHLEEEFEGGDDETIPQFTQEILDNGK
ncbi:hypothetical protein FB451DRAFT_1360332 [Mycena latifolia]|nr:hypothetical protein FB451DRAFT_1360332 [Mycena latifolia]